MSQPRQLLRKDGTRTESWGEARGMSRHPLGCRCVRCDGFQPGNELSTKHGAYSVVQLAPRAREVSEAIEAALVAGDLWRPGFAAAVAACATTLVRLERAEAALSFAEDALSAEGANPVEAYIGRGGEDPLGRLRQDARRWSLAARSWLSDLGLTPRAFAAIAKDTGLARASRSQAAMRALGEHVEREHAGEVES